MIVVAGAQASGSRMSVLVPRELVGRDEELRWLAVA
jgi:hypothetical protein